MNPMQAPNVGVGGKDHGNRREKFTPQEIQRLEAYMGRPVYSVRADMVVFTGGRFLFNETIQEILGPKTIQEMLVSK